MVVCIALAFLVVGSVGAPAAADHGSTDEVLGENRTADWGDHERADVNATDRLTNASTLDGNATRTYFANGTIQNATRAKLLAGELDGVSAEQLMENATVRREVFRNLTVEEAEAIANHSGVTVNASVLLGLDTDPKRAAQQDHSGVTDSVRPDSEDARGEADSTAGVVLAADIAPTDGTMGLNARLMPGVSVPMAMPSSMTNPLAIDRTESAGARDVSSSTDGTGTAAPTSGTGSTLDPGTTSPTPGTNDGTVPGGGGDDSGETPSSTESTTAAEGANATSTLLGGVTTTLDGLLGGGAPLAPASLFTMSLLTVATRPWVGFLSTAAVLLGDWLGRVGVLFRFGRSSTSDPLEHETRARIHDRIQRVPGSSLTELSETLDVPISTLRHHLKVLEREGEVVSHKQRNRRRFYPLGAENEALTAALAEDTSADIIDALRRRGSATVGEVVDAVDRSYSTVSYHLSRLAEEGVVVQRTEGRQTISRLDSSVASRLRSAAETESAEFGQQNGEASAD